jgi:hypothetical protein
MNRSLGINHGQNALCSKNLFIIPSTMSLDLDNAEILFVSVDSAVDLTFDRAKAIVAPLIYSENRLFRSATKRSYNNKNFISLANLR